MIQEDTCLAASQRPYGRSGDLLLHGFLRESLDKVRGLTMVHEAALIDLAHQMDAVLADSVPGDFVECGVWCGGASFFMADLLRRLGIKDRKVWLFDSFEGMPRPQTIDGPAAEEWARTPEKPWYSGKVPFSLEGVQHNASRLGLADYTELVKGWFDQTLPAQRQRVGQIALLRIDCDWYASVKCCLDNLYDLVGDGGFIVLDDYYTYDGCTIAVHEFLSNRKLVHRIETVLGDWQGTQVFHAARFRKGSTNWQLRHRQVRLSAELAANIPAGHRFIFIDEEHCRGELPNAQFAIPFPECNGFYNGQPQDSNAAIEELERLRTAGAAFVVIAWPAFWWLDYFPEFHQHLTSRYECVVKNDRLILFDLARPPRISEPACEFRK